VQYGAYHDTKHSAYEGRGISSIRTQDYLQNFENLEGLWVLTELERF
jgi:hypothetical protein